MAVITYSGGVWGNRVITETLEEVPMDRRIQRLKNAQVPCFNYYISDRIELLEVWSVLAHDYGLYGVQGRLDRMGFKPRPHLCYDSLTPDQKAYYEAKQDLAESTRAYSDRLGE
jgi:hypothetical protein